MDTQTDSLQQSATGQAPSTGNPQDISSQSNALQNASPQSVDQIRALDQSTEALQVSGTDQAISLSGIEATSTVALQQAPAPTTNTAHVWLYGAVGLTIVLFAAFLLYGLFKPQHAE